MPNTTSLTLTVSDLVFNQGEQIRTTSLKIAETFNKRHDDVLRKLRSLECSDEFIDRNFTGNEYKDKRGRSLPLYEMTKDGFMFLVMGFTGKKAAHIKEAYINAFNQMASQLRSSLPVTTSQAYAISHFPNHFDSGWINACYQRSATNIRSAWVHHVRVIVKPHPTKSCLLGTIVLGIGGEGELLPEHDTEKGMYRGGSYEFAYRQADELWERMRETLFALNARSPY